jgi:hypothetical protein
MDPRLQDGDQLIAISEDDDTIRLSGLTSLGIEEGLIQLHQPKEPRPERTLILGWNWRAPTIIQELDNYVAPGSVVTVMADLPDAGQEEDEMAHQCPHLTHLNCNFEIGDTTDRRTLEAVAPETYDHLIVLSYSDRFEDPQAADARTLITLLHLRDMATRLQKDFSIVSEMLDMRNRALAEVTQADDFIVSDRLISLMLSQISENKRLNAVFTDIFDPDGSEIYLKPAGNYVTLGKPMNFYTVIEAARRRGEVAFGYRLKANAGNAGQSYGVVVNPDKSQKVTFGEGDRIVMLAEN